MQSKVDIEVDVTTLPLTFKKVYDWLYFFGGILTCMGLDQLI